MRTQLKLANIERVKATKCKICGIGVLFDAAVISQQRQRDCSSLNTPCRLSCVVFLRTFCTYRSIRTGHQQRRYSGEELATELALTTQVVLENYRRGMFSALKTLAALDLRHHLAVMVLNASVLLMQACLSKCTQSYAPKCSPQTKTVAVESATDSIPAQLTFVITYYNGTYSLTSVILLICLLWTVIRATVGVLRTQSTYVR
jgi:hypothetical protein